VPISWKANSSNFGVGFVKTRQTFCDEAIAHSKNIPSPCSYSP
jgi:hypothetical protein